jgi:hypothetical protein
MTKKEELLNFITTNIDIDTNKKLIVVEVPTDIHPDDNYITYDDIISRSLSMPNDLIIKIIEENFSDNLQGRYPYDNKTLYKIKSWNVE